MLDAVRLGPEDEETAVTAGQVRDVVTRLTGAGQWSDGDPGILVVFDAGYDVPGWPSCWPTFRCNWWGSAATGCCASPPRRASRARRASRPPPRRLGTSRR